MHFNYNESKLLFPKIDEINQKTADWVLLAVGLNFYSISSTTHAKIRS